VPIVGDLAPSATFEHIQCILWPKDWAFEGPKKPVRCGAARVQLFVPIVLTLGLFACECQRPILKRALPPDVRVDTYTQQAASKIDVLWVVDNSGSMLPRQENLARNFQAFINEFTRNAIDYRIAVTTTDIFKEKGALVGAPKVLTPMTPDVLTKFALNVKVGTTGSPYEVGFEAARLAIEKANDANALTIQECKRACQSKTACLERCDSAPDFDFLRKEAFLYIVFVTDEEDKSAQDVRYFYRYFETAKGIGNNAMVTTAAIMGNTGNACGATPGARYQQLAELTGGVVGSICDANFSATLKKLGSNAVGLKRKFSLQTKPNVETLKISLRYPCNVAADQLSKCASVEDSECQGTPAEALNVVCTPVRGLPDGWVYEASNNGIFFAGESVPGLRAQIEFQYYEQGKGP
jgi:hypothetical protein